MTERKGNVGGLARGEQRPESQQEEAQENARPNNLRSDDDLGRDANRSGSEANA
jgi:hypothetical protein